MAERLPFTLRTYRLLAGAATPLFGLVTRYRLRRGKEHPSRLGERRGITRIERPDAPLVWVHAASVGEMLAVVPITEYLVDNGFAVLVTSGTMTSAMLAEERLPPEAIHQFVPHDTPRFVARFLDHWQPDLGLFAESDLWPNLITAAAERQAPLILVNGRLSRRSFRRWRMMPRTIGALLRAFDLCLAQTVTDAERFNSLGAPRIATTGNLKLDVPAPPVHEEDLAEFVEVTGDRPVIAGASTHPGEESILISAHKALAAEHPGLLTVIVPRHPERGAGILDIAAAAGLNAVARSSGYLPDRGTEIYVADTIGELGLFYRVAPVVFVGGSLVRHGGQNPIEAAKLGSAVLHGPHVWNFSEIYGVLDRVDGAVEIRDAAALQAGISAWLKDPQARAVAAAAALTAVEGLSGARTRTLAALEPYLMGLRLNYR